MFSPNDIQDLIHLFRPRTVLDDEIKHDQANSKSLLPAESGQDFVVFDKVVHRLKHKVHNAYERIDVSSISKELDISDSTVLRMLQGPPSTAIFSENKRFIVPARETKRISDQLLDYSKSGLVCKTQFAHDNNISSNDVDVLLAGMNDWILQLIQPQSGTLHLTAIKYRDSLDKQILKSLEISQDEARSLDLTSKQFTGNPPMWFISERARELSKQTSTINGILTLKDDTVSYQPESYLVKARDYTIDQLRSGTMSHSDLAQFTETLPELYKEVSDVQKYFEASLGDRASFASGYAISKTWLELYRRNEVQKVVDHGYSDVSSSIRTDFPEQLQAALLVNEPQQIVSSFKELPNASSLTSVNQYLIRDDYLQELIEFITDTSRTQAQAQWAQLEQNPAHDCTLVESDIYSSFSEDGEHQDHLSVFQAVFETHAVQAKSAFVDQVAELELQSETEFASFWSDRVTTRFQVYKTGAEAIADPKLRTQLCELLHTHAIKELIPDALSRAQSKSLLRSKKTQKATQKLAATLKSAADLTAVSSSLDKFARKQGMDMPTPKAIAEKKTSQLKELSRAMKKDSDGPRLFLTLMVLLLASRNAGIVYATGKFAPKLMKLLRESVDDAEYEQLEKWKDSVKAGSLSADDKAQMRAFATAGQQEE